MVDRLGSNCIFPLVVRRPIKDRSKTSDPETVPNPFKGRSGFASGVFRLGFISKNLKSPSVAARGRAIRSEDV